MRRIERRWTDGSFWQWCSRGSIPKAVLLLRVAVVCLSRKLGLLIVHRQLRWFKEWIRVKGYVRSSDSKSVQDSLPAPRSWLWDCGKSVTQVEFHKVFTHCFGREQSIEADVSQFWCALFSSAWKHSTNLFSPQLTTLVVTNRGIDSLSRSDGLRDLNDTDSCVRGVAGFSVLVRFCMFVGLIMAFSLSGRLGQSAGSYLTMILNRLKYFDSCLWQLDEAKLYRVSYVSRFGLALWQSWQSSPSFDGRLTILR